MDAKNEKDKTEEMLRVFAIEMRRTNPFGQNSLGDHAYRRAERVVAGVYLLTSHIPDNEPLKARVRSVGTELLHAVLSLRPGFHSAGEERVADVETAILNIASLVRVLAISGYISFENMETLVGALDDLGALCGAERRSLSEHVRLAREHFLPAPRRTHAPQHVVKDSIKDTDKGHQRTTKSSMKDEGEDVRSKTIVSVIGTLGSCGIKDISARVPEYSEKMIQRALAELVASGVVLKKGEKRWSRYTLSS